MLRFYVLPIFFLLFSTPVYCEYVKPDSVSEEEWREISSHLIPFSHALKIKLDRMFQKGDPTKNGYELYKAGFRFLPLRTGKNAFVAKHSKMKGYVFKVYTQDQPVVDDWRIWQQRIRGAELIRKEIVQKGYEHLFKVPRKWIYMILQESGPKFLLIAEDMRLVSSEKNYYLWQNAVSFELLDALYDLLTTLGLHDSVFADNIPFAKDRRVAFIDTEHYLSWPINYQKMDDRLNYSRKVYWKRLTRR